MKHINTLLIAIVFSITALYAQQTSIFVNHNNSRIYYTKQGTGEPAVIFVSGMATDHFTWKVVQDSLSAKTLTVSYDRAGLGESEYHGEKKDINSMVNELDELITNINVREPFILVGHSMGCQVIKKFASLYPQKIKGLVFVDPGYNEKFLKAIIPDTLWQQRANAIKQYQPDFNEAQLAEEKNHTEVNEAADSITKLPNVPIIFFTATMVTDFPASAMEQKVKMERHFLWLKSMPDAKHILVNTSWHYIQIDAPYKVIDAIESLLATSEKS